MSVKKTVKAGDKGSKAAGGEKGVKVVADAEGKVEGVLLSVVKPELVEAELAKLKLSTDGDLPAQVQRLVLHFREATPAADIADCSTCGGDSNADEAVCPVCPYCGVGGAVDSPKMEVPSKTATAAPTSPEEPPAKSEATPPPPKAAEPTKGQPEATVGAAPVDPKVAKKTVTTADGQALVQTKGKGAAAPLADGKALTEADLDVALADAKKAIDAAEKMGVGCYWDIGQAVYAIFAKKLYLQRRGKDGRPKHETWGGFCSEELGMSGGNAHRYMDVAANYPREMAIDLGIRKLNAALRIEEPEKRMKLLEGAKAVTADDFEQKIAKVVEKEQAGKHASRGRLTLVQEERNAKGTKAAVAKDTAGKAANVAKPPPAAEGKEKITAALALGRTTVKLFKAGEKATDPEAKRAKRLADGPVGWEETVNGVTSKYTVASDAEGCLVIRIDRKRVG